MPKEIWEQTNDEVFRALGSSDRGLPEVEVVARRLRHGANAIEATPTTPMALRFLANFYHLMALLLWTAAVLAFIGGQPELAWTIIAVIVINAIFSQVNALCSDVISINAIFIKINALSSYVIKINAIVVEINALSSYVISALVW